MIQKAKLKNKDFTLSEKLSSLPHLPGVYLFKNEKNNLLYIGKAIDLKKRVSQYFTFSKNHSPRIKVMIEQIADLETISTKNEIEALILESNLIKERNPRYNVVLRDGKSYPYIVITKEPYPRVFVTRRVLNDGAKYFGPFTDLFALRTSLKTVRDIFKIRSCNYFIDEKSIESKKIKVCLDYQIKKCDGPCEGLISQNKYNEMIENVEQVLRGKISSLRDKLQIEMKNSANQNKFEDAATQRDKIKALDVYINKQKVLDLKMQDRDVVSITKQESDACGIILTIREGKLLGKRHYFMGNILASTDEELIELMMQKYYSSGVEIPNEIILPIEIESIKSMSEYLTDLKNDSVKIISPKKGDKILLIKLAEQNAKLLLNEYLFHKIKIKQTVPHVLKSLQRDLRLEKIPKRIECFDISHFQGSETVASLVVLENGKPKKSDYRKFKIISLASGEVDDFKSIREVVFRRYKRVQNEKLNLPNLIIIDGGKGQLSSAIESLEKLNLQNIPIISLAKRLEEVFIPNQSEPIILPKTSSSLKLLQQIRNEAHRFAVTFHSQLRSKRTLETELEAISGVGKKRVKELIETFGSVEKVRHATTEQLSKIVGEKLAQKIILYFSDNEQIEL